MHLNSACRALKPNCKGFGCGLPQDMQHARPTGFWTRPDANEQTPRYGQIPAFPGLAVDEELRWGNRGNIEISRQVLGHCRSQQTTPPSSWLHNHLVSYYRGDFEYRRSIQGDSGTAVNLDRVHPPRQGGYPSFSNKWRGERNVIGYRSRRTNRHEPFKSTTTYHSQDIIVCYIQETYRQSATSFKVRGYKWVRWSNSDILTPVRNNINTIQTSTHMDDYEFQVLNLWKNGFGLKLVNFYSTNGNALSLDSIPVDETNFTVVGYIISPNKSWGYDKMDNRGDELETWHNDNKLNPINPRHFYSREWHTTPTHDRAFCTDNLYGHAFKRGLMKLSIFAVLYSRIY